jgi:hypothetical protein
LHPQGPATGFYKLCTHKMFVKILKQNKKIEKRKGGEKNWD